ncbi:PfkB family carbohydrate kinase [Parabacteroides sp. Marseille-P3160]|uniref:PfkB family carbohydrate kinase n=1 Tax=Parabacteroides sp. Marseille-P3160 TaxID=1917887 RepID=UPI0009B9CD0F|nr:PfkB family carbohydrate kinase [Parabacteroides sp. Marseille-P3160]
MQYDLCCVGHITLDKVITPRNTVQMPGGTSFYCSEALSLFTDIRYKLITALGKSEYPTVEHLREKGVEVEVMPSRHSVYFENRYGEDQDNRAQRVLAKADPFTLDAFRQTEAQIFLLGALLADDFSPDIVKSLSGKALVAVDSQGYLREVRDTRVYPVDWTNKREVLPYIHFLKVNEEEMEVLTGYKDIRHAARLLYEWGVREVLITMGSRGSVLYDGRQFYSIPAYEADKVLDATGCGDTYFTGYLYQRSKGTGMEQSGHFGAAMATLKIERIGPFSGTKGEVLRKMETARKRWPEKP